MEDDSKARRRCPGEVSELHQGCIWINYEMSNSGNGESIPVSTSRLCKGPEEGRSMGHSGGPEKKKPGQLEPSEQEQGDKVKMGLQQGQGPGCTGPCGPQYDLPRCSEGKGRTGVNGEKKTNSRMIKQTNVLLCARLKRGLG